MLSINEKLSRIRANDQNGKVRIMIIGLGSVGCYLLDYLMSTGDPHLEIIVAGRNREKMESDVNIVRVASLIRRQNRSNVIIADGVDLEQPETVAECLRTYQPDIIVNTSRVYAGLKYGSISWKNVRAYGIWIPLSIKYIRNIMQAYSMADCNAVVINTSYSDGTIPWLKSAGMAYPEFGSGNLNHLLPRIKFAAAREMQIPDFWNINVILATAHFHDVVISKEGQNEGIEQLLRIEYNGKVLPLDQDDILRKSQIPMPVDAKRNMMNASSNYDIIMCLLRALRSGSSEIFYAPGAFGEIGGYPVKIDGAACTAEIDTATFPMELMREKNRASLALDGIERIENGVMSYTDALIAKAQKAFGVTLPKQVAFDQINETAEMIIREIIQPALGK